MATQIKINLKAQKVEQAAILGGIDLSKLNLKMVILCTLFTTIAPMVATSLLNAEKAKLQRDIDQVIAEKKNYEEKLLSLQSQEDKILGLQKLEEGFKKKLEVYQGILKENVNPMKVLQFMAENIPETVWIDRLEIANKQITINGGSLDYKSIGQFVENLNRGVFFDQQVKLDDYKTVENEKTKMRVEEFKISSKIARFE